MSDLFSEAFEILSKGVIVSLNSDKYFEIANFLNVDENFEEFDEIVGKIGFRLFGENGYFYLGKNKKLDQSEIESFISNHKKMIVAISILKEVYPLVSSGEIIQITNFIVDLKAKKSDIVSDKFKFLFGETDKKSMVEEFFKLLEKGFVIEKLNTTDKDSYKILNSINYFVGMIESV
jgi:hypothetical protein